MLEMEAAITLRAEIRKDAPDLSVAELNELISQTTLLPTFNAVDLAYRNLIGDGTLADLSNSNLKKELAEFFAATELTKSHSFELGCAGRSRYARWSVDPAKPAGINRFLVHFWKWSRTR